MSGERNLIEIQHLQQYFPAGGHGANKRYVQAVDDVSLFIRKGETLGLVGETGAGKTTLARGIMRLIPDPPGQIVSGEILFDGKDLLRLSIKEMRKYRGSQISMIFQDPMTSLNPVMTVGDQIREVVVTHHPEMSRQEARKHAEEMVGITATRYDDYPHQFSGGMKQRVVIAIALAGEPRLLIADEPTTALDVTIQAQVLEMIHALKRKSNTAMPKGCKFVDRCKYATDRCREEVPQLTDMGDGHKVRCFRRESQEVKSDG